MMKGKVCFIKLYIPARKDLFGGEVIYFVGLLAIGVA